MPCATTSCALAWAILLFFIVLTFVGPLLTPYDPTEFVGPPGAPPSAQFWFGTTTFGEDVFSQFVHGLASTFLVGIVGGGIGTLLGMIDRLYRRVPGRGDG